MIIAGVDEAGRGALAGPVVAGAVILPKKYPKELFADSKVLTKTQREQAFAWIEKNCVWAAGEATAQEIDELGIKPATNLAMKRTVKKLKQKPDHLYVDGRDRFVFSIPSTDFVKGDALHPVISAASIVAKVIRDQKMCELAEKFCRYNFERNKGYGTKFHVQQLESVGHCEVHRKTYDPLKTMLIQTKLF